jgi:hypothetical protein
MVKGKMQGRADVRLPHQYPSWQIPMDRFFFWLQASGNVIHFMYNYAVDREVHFPTGKVAVSVDICCCCLFLSYGIPPARH